MIPIEDENVKQISRDRVVTAPDPARDETPVQGAASPPNTAPQEIPAPDVAAQPIFSLESSNVPPPRIFGGQPPPIGTVTASSHGTASRGAYVS